MNSIRIATQEQPQLISHIHSTTVVVADQQKALDFYVNVLGWEKAMDAPMGPDLRWLTVVPPGATTQLVLATASWRGGDGSPNRDSGISMATPDIDATSAALAERGVRFKEPVQTMPWGQRATWFYDLDGNEFFLAEE